MRLTFLVTLCFVAVFAGSFWYNNTAHICPVPISYRVGLVDERFSLGADELKSVANEAELVWEKATKQELYTYDEKATFTINLIYDERQQLASTEEEWRIRLDLEQISYEQLVKELEELATRYQTQETSYTTKRTEYETALAVYNDEVESYNKDGGAPHAEYERLQRTAKIINDQATVLGNLERDLNELADTLNAKGEAGNIKISSYNKEVEEYNELFGDRDKFTQGDYERQRINIYKFTDTDELRQVLVHEFGHALGIGHVENKESVMYYLMTEQKSSSELSAEDRSAFDSTCGELNTTSAKLRRMIREVIQILDIRY